MDMLFNGITFIDIPFLMLKREKKENIYINIIDFSRLFLVLYDFNTFFYSVVFKHFRHFQILFAYC